jgi:hypothetical protein
MKKFFVSVGLAVAGTASLHAIYAPELGPVESTRMWSISADLRGFYDDNYTTGASKVGSYGIEFSPQFQVIEPLQQTELGLRYTYGLYYFQQREELDVNPIDQSHDLDLWVDHAFSERWQIKVLDSFVVAQEPDLVQGGTPYRVEGNNIKNSAAITLNTVWTRLFSTALTYNNSFWDFQQSGATVTPPLLIQNPNPPFNTLYIPPSVVNSLAGTLNRIDQSVSLDFQWIVATETIALFGVQFEQVNYTGDELIAYNPFGDPNLFSPVHGPEFYYSDNRDNRSYFCYLGIMHSLLPNLNFSVKAGVQYTEDYNDPLSSPSVAPYVIASATYTYQPGCYAQIGFSQQRSATDVVGVSTNSASLGQLTLDQESSVAFATLNQKITPKLLGSIIGSWQYSVFDEGQYNGAAEVSYALSLNLSYSFTPHFAATAGYNFNDFQSNIYQRGYTRNNVYIGVWVAY